MVVGFSPVIALSDTVWDILQPYGLGLLYSMGPVGRLASSLLAWPSLQVQQFLGLVYAKIIMTVSVVCGPVN